MAVSRKKTAKPAVAETPQVSEIDQLREDLARGFEFGANELRPLFGQGALAMVFDSIAKGIRKHGK